MVKLASLTTDNVLLKTFEEQQPMKSQTSIRNSLILLGAIFVVSSGIAADKSNDSLPAMTPETLPADIPALWATFDATRDPLDVKVLHEYEKDGVTVQMVSYVVGTFKGKQVRMGGYYLAVSNRA